MGVITNNWNDESGDSITIESPSFKGNQTITISSPVQKDTVKRSMIFIGKCKNDPTKTVKLIIEQAASQYTYDLILNTDSSTIAASGGTVTITGTLKTYRNGELVNTETVIPKLSGSSTGFSISNNKVTAASRGTTVGETRSISITGSYNNTYDGQTVQSSIVIAQAANEVSYGNVSISGGTVSDIPASGGSISSASGISTSQTVSYTSGSTRAGSVTISYSSAVTAGSKGTTISNKTSVGTLIVTATGEGSKKATKSFTIYQAGNYVTKINYLGGSLSYPTIGAGDTSATPTFKENGHSLVFTSGSIGNNIKPTSTFGTFVATAKYSLESIINGFTAVNSGSGVLTATNRGSIIGSARTSGIVSKDVIMTWTPTSEYNAGGTITGTGTLTATCTQEANTLSWGTPTISRTTPVSIAATGGTNNVATGLTYSQKGTYSSGATTSANSGGTLSYAVQTAKTGFSLSGSTVTVTNNTSLSARNGFIVRITLVLNGKTATKDITYNQAAGYYTYANPVVTVKCNDVPASGGSVTSGTVTYSQTYGWNGATSGIGTITSGGSVSWSGGASNIPSLGTTVKARSVVGNKLVAVVTLNGKSGTGKVDVYQAANSATYGNLTGGSVSAADIPASGGTRSASVTNMTQTITFTSGSSRKGTVTNSQTAAITGSNLGTTVKSRTKLGSITVTFTGEGSKTATKSVDVYQAANSITSYEYGNWIISISANPTTISAAGGTSTITRSCTRSKTPIYTSGSKGSATTESTTPTLSISGTGFTLNGTTVTASKNNTAQRTATVTASYSGATSKSVKITQNAGSNGIGYMQIEGNGIDHYIFKVG